MSRTDFCRTITSLPSGAPSGQNQTYQRKPSLNRKKANCYPKPTRMEQNPSPNWPRQTNRLPSRPQLFNSCQQPKTRIPSDQIRTPHRHHQRHPQKPAKLDAILKMEAQIQYLLDTTSRHNSKLAEEIRSLNCEIQRLRYVQATATAQYKGWLAAKQLPSSACTKLVARGSMILTVKYRPTNVTCETEMMEFGPQTTIQT